VQQAAESEQQPGSTTAPSLQAPASASVSGASPGAAPSGSQQPAKAKPSVRGGVTSQGVEIDPANPLHKMLPETECEFCLETREKLWGMVKQLKKAPPAGGAAGAAGAAQASAPAPRGPATGAQVAAAAAPEG
jgi:hypothetical protein